MFFLANTTRDENVYAGGTFLEMQSKTQTADFHLMSGTGHIGERQDNEDNEEVEISE